MLLYNYEVSFENIDKQLEKSFILEELKTLSVDTSHVLYFNNNQYRKVAITSDKPFSDNEKDQTINFLVENVVTFSVQNNQSKIYYRVHSEGSEYLTKYWLYHTFLPILLTLKNIYYFLHAGAVEVDSKPILFIANSFGGKSTLTDYFIKKNHTLISDDKVGIYEENNQFFSVPSYPYHRPYRKVEDLGFLVNNFAKDCKPIHAIFNLVKADKKSKVLIEEIYGLEKFRALKLSTEIDLPINNESRFKTISDIANKTKVYNISVPWDLDRLEEVYQEITNFLK